jgi:CDP-glucose 4,6-dehydratase
VAGRGALEMLVRSASWEGRRVLVTGHTGFKGGWLSLWLQSLGADVSGFALPAPAGPSFFEQVRLCELLHHVEGDIRDLGAVEQVMQAAQPQVVFHLAAQPLVRDSYKNPVETYATNVMGTVNVLDACRRVGSVEAVVCVTSDKCYENREWPWAYRETDPMGGHDPYSSSKGAAELVVTAYRRSYFQSGCRIASVRAGNVIGGGDWAQDRLVPDIIRALLAGEKPLIRSPNSVRPWQHVLDALAGYLLVAQRLLEGRDECASAWNFGPSDQDTRPVRWIVERLLAEWGAEGWERPGGEQPHEAVQLRLDSSRARTELGWEPALGLEQALKFTSDWHAAVAHGADARAISLGQMDGYGGQQMAAMEQKEWA